MSSLSSSSHSASLLSSVQPKHVPSSFSRKTVICFIFLIGVVFFCLQHQNGSWIIGGQPQSPPSWSSILANQQPTATSDYSDTNKCLNCWYVLHRCYHQRHCIGFHHPLCMLPQHHITYSSRRAWRWVFIRTKDRQDQIPVPKQDYNGAPKWLSRPNLH